MSPPVPLRDGHTVGMGGRVREQGPVVSLPIRTVGPFYRKQNQYLCASAGPQHRPETLEGMSRLLSSLSPQEALMSFQGPQMPWKGGLGDSVPSDIRMTHLLKVNRRPSAPPALGGAGRSILKGIWKIKGPQGAKTVWKKKKKVGEVTLLDFKPQCKATVTKTCGAGRRTDTETDGTEWRGEK